jgi:type I restriction enzyme S subunit
MRDGWTETTLDGIAEYINGYPFKPADLGEVGLPVIRIKQLLDPNEPVDRTSTDTPDRCLLRDGDIVFSWSGTLAVRIWNRGPAKLNQHLFRVVEKKGVYKGIIPLILEHSIEELEEKSHGTTMKHITKQTLLPHKVLLPPLPEQKRIVDLISSVDTYVEALQQQLESAKKSRNAVLHELMTARGNDWVVRKLPEVVEVLDRMRKPINSTEREDRKGNIPYYGANGQTGWIDEFIFNEELVLLGEDAIDFADPSARKAYLIQGPSWVNNHAHVLRADKTIVNSYFLMESLNKVDYSQYVSFGTRSKLTQASMNGIKLLIPPMNIQEKFVDLLENFDKVIEATQRSIEDSKELRTGMLSNLLSGEHEIPTSYDKFIGAA